MKKRKERFVCVYAGPDMMAKLGNGRGEDEPEREDYPNSFLDDDEDNVMEEVYAGPDMMNKDEAEINEAGEEERESYPDSFFVDEKPDPAMEKVYAGPDMMLNPKTGRVEPVMQAVYACPPMPPVSDDPPMMAVYAGPEMMQRPRGIMRSVYAVPKFSAGECVKPRYCPNCGTPADEKANFCSNCGTQLPRNDDPPKKPKLGRDFAARPKGSRDELV